MALPPLRSVGRMAALVLAVLPAWGCTEPPRPAAALPVAPIPQGPASLVGEWIGRTERSGTVTLVLQADGRFRYAFSGGAKEQGGGHYALRAGALVLTRERDNRAQTWTATLDLAQLRLRTADGQTCSLMRRPS